MASEFLHVAQAPHTECKLAPAKLTVNPPEPRLNRGGAIAVAALAVDHSPMQRGLIASIAVQLTGAQ